MLRGRHVVLRAVEREDVAQLHAWDADHDEWALGNEAPYVPRTGADALVRYDAGERWRAGDRAVPFAVEAAASLVGVVSLWGIDLHNRKAHLGIGLSPQARGRGYGSDACRVLLRYAFLDRGLRRVQLEVLADNEGALRAYRAVGFVEDGRLRDDAWVQGRWVDQVVMSVLSTDASPPEPLSPEPLSTAPPRESQVTPPG